MPEILIFCKDFVENLYDGSFKEIFHNVFPNIAISLDEDDWDILALDNSYDITSNEGLRIIEMNVIISIETLFESLSKELIADALSELAQAGKDGRELAKELEKTKIIYAIDYKEEDTIGIKWIYFLSLASVLCFKGNGFICIGETEWYFVDKVWNEFFLKLMVDVS